MRFFHILNCDSEKKHKMSFSRKFYDSQKKPQNVVFPQNVVYFPRFLYGLVAQRIFVFVLYPIKMRILQKKPQNAVFPHILKSEKFSD